MSARANQLLEAGLWLKMSGDLEGARRLFEQALKLDPESIRARELLGHSVPESEAVPEELRDVPITRSDLFSVPLPRLFQDEAPASPPDEWWNAPPSDGMGGNTSRFFVRPSASGSPEAPGPIHTIPWGPSPVSKNAEEFQGDDLGQSGDDFGLELSEGTPATLSRSGPKPVPVLSPAELLSPAAAASSLTTGAILLPPDPGIPSPLPAEPPGANPFSVAAASGAGSPVPGSLRPATTGAIPLPPFATPAPARPTTFKVAPPDPESPRSTGPVPLPPTVAPVRATPAPAPPWHPPAPAPRGATTLETHVVVPLPSKGGPGQPSPDPSSSLEPLPWAMPATPPPLPGSAPSKASGPVPLPSGKGSTFSPPRGSPAAAPPPPAFPPPPESIEIASDAWGGEGDGPTVLAPEEPAPALELLAEPRIVSGLTPLPAPRDPRAEAVRLFERARELQNLDDHSGARELLLQAQGFYPELTGLTEALARSETKLQTIYESKIGKLSAVPRVRLKEDEVIWLNLDHRAGFMLAQIDGTLSFEDLFSVSGMSRLDTARILAQLLDQRVIVS
ncbi:MAG TPA: hypothetical protein VFN45_02250 [Myxococcaceae bacterium]|nr:hypothetical protein [Myxococcaceae bacterium]